MRRRFGFGLVLLATTAVNGCSLFSKDREMRPPLVEEFTVPPAGSELPPDVPRAESPLVPKPTAPLPGGVGGPGGGGGGLPTGGFRPGR